MPVSNIVDEKGFLIVDTRKKYETEVFRETLSGILLVERRNLPAQAMLWIMMVMAATRLPDPEFFLLPLILRLIAVLHTHFAARWLGGAIEARRPIAVPLCYSAFALFAGGATWGLLLGTVMAEPVLHPARLVLGGGTLVGVSLVAAIMGPAYRLLISFLCGFVITTCAAMWWWAVPMWFPAAMATFYLTLILIAFAIALSAQRILTSRTLVENRVLSEELADSLAHAEFLAYRDPLTGLMNRRAFFECVGGDGKTEDRFLLSLDLDNFKTVNDRFGHAVGDKVLVKVGAAIKNIQRSLPDGDHCAVRLGGEEFVMLLDTTDRAIANAAAEDLRRAVEAIAAGLKLPGLATTCSIGLSRWRSGSGIDEVLSDADCLLYQAKARGKNRVENTTAA